MTYRGYWAHCLRMGSIGEPSDGYRRLYEADLKAHPERLTTFPQDLFVI